MWKDFLGLIFPKKAPHDPWRTLGKLQSLTFSTYVPSMGVESGS